MNLSGITDPSSASPIRSSGECRAAWRRVNVLRKLIFSGMSGGRWLTSGAWGASKSTP